MSPVIKIIRPAGLLDRTRASQFNQEVNKCLEVTSDVDSKLDIPIEVTPNVKTKADIVLINFKDVTFMDSSGLGAVVLAIKTVQAAGMEIYVCSLNNQLNMLFELSGLNKVIEIFSDEEEFKQKFGLKKSS